MPRLRASRVLACFALAWFTLFVSAGSVAPWLKPRAIGAVCSAGGFESLSTAAKGRHDKSASWHLVKCPLCLPLSGPPAPDVMLQTLSAVCAEQLQLPSSTGHVASVAAAPLPARGPPSFA